jgi:HEAT repeat protein
MSMIKDPSAVPALIETALDAGELSRVREHALRVAVRLQPALVPPAIAGMAKDSNPTVRKSAAFEARYVRAKAVVTPLIELISDPERFVAISAVQSLWLLTRHDGPMHDWEISTPDQRAEWAQEWVEWWESVQETFELPEPRKSGQRR